MSDYENRLSDYIDTLNEERKPKEHGEVCEDQELEKLYDTVRSIKSLKEPALPGEDFPRRLSESVAREFGKNKRTKHKKKSWLRGMTAAVTAMLLMALTFNYLSPFNNQNYAYAMEKAFEGIKAYHGILEIITTNAKGQEDTQVKLEVWADKKGHYYVKQLEGAQKGLVIVNNGEQKWQFVSEQGEAPKGEKNVYIFPAFPDPYIFSFEIGKEIELFKKAVSTNAAGEENVGGREASILEVSPQGGESYRIWIDKETKLPLKKESAWNNALRYTAVYTDIKFIDAIPAELMAYKVPSGFKEVNTNPEFVVTNIDEAQNMAGFAVSVPESTPSGYVQNAIAVQEKTVKLYYKAEGKENTRIVLLQGKANGEFKPAPNAIQGKINNMQAEIQLPIEAGSGIIGSGPYGGVTGLSSIRWMQEGKEYAVVGNESIEVLSEFAAAIAGGTLEMPSPGGQPFKPQIEVPVDLEIAKNDQKSVDGGHSPWQLDPVFVSQVFVSLKISPEGIVGDYPVKMEDLKIVYNTGVEAIVEVAGENTPVRKVYLKRLIRQDETGIWSVVGYDPL